MRRRSVVAIAVVLAVIFLGFQAAPAEAASPGDFVSRINSLRASKGLSSLSVDSRLSSQAQSWAQQMANVNKISHNPNLGSTPGNWTKVGENVGTGGTVDAIFNALVNSSSHYRNMVGDYNSVGVGVAMGSDGRIYTCHVFANFPSAKSTPPTTAKPASSPTTKAPAKPASSSGSNTTKKTSTTKAPATSPSTTPPVKEEEQQSTPAATPAPAPEPSVLIVVSLREVGSIAIQG